MDNRHSRKLPISAQIMKHKTKVNHSQEQSASPRNVISNFLGQRFGILTDIGNKIDQKKPQQSKNSSVEHSSVTPQYYNAIMNSGLRMSTKASGSDSATRNNLNNFNTGRLLSTYLLDEREIKTTKPSRSSSKPPVEEYSATQPSSLSRPKKQLSSYLLENKGKTLNLGQVQKQLLGVSSLRGSTTVTLPPDAIQEHIIELAVLKFESVIGQGSFAMVKLAKHSLNNQKYAVKVYEKHKMTDPQKCQIMKKEIAILKQMNHPNIIKLHTVLEDSRQHYLVMEYVSSLSLSQFAKTRIRLSERESKQIFHQLMRAVCYLHNNQIAHRDIKSENILMQSNNQIKLIDFGFATQITSGVKTNVFCGTPNYMSPEMITKVPHNPQSSDIWSCGILLYTLLCGEHPFKASNNKDLSRKIQVGNWKIPDNVYLSTGCQRIIGACLDKNIDRRWTANRIVDDEWFN